MVPAFLYALRDCDDATLVLKLISSSPQAIHRVISVYRRLDVSHRCRLVLIPGFFSEADMLELARVSTYYLTTTRAEGNCLPLMNYLAAGRPRGFTAHTAIGDYFDSRVGFVVQSHPEPAAWPQDSRLRWRTNWHRLVWPSLVEQIRRSYEVAKHDRAAYQALAAAGQENMRQWAHPDAVWHAYNPPCRCSARTANRPCEVAPTSGKKKPASAAIPGKRSSPPARVLEPSVRQPSVLRRRLLRDRPAEMGSR